MTAPIVSVGELVLTYQAALKGGFQAVGCRNGAALGVATPDVQFQPEARERVLLVCAAAPAVGTSTIALALAAAVDGRARVVECCSVAASGLASASSAELGQMPGGWMCSTRDTVRIERCASRATAPSQVPLPVADPEVAWTFLDSSWDLDVVLGGGGWLAQQAADLPAVVVVSRATIPGMRRLDAALDLVGQQRVVAVVVGAGRRWPRLVEQSASAAVRRLRAADRVVSVPWEATLALTGLTPDPLPVSVRAAGGKVLEITKGLLA